MITGVVKPRRSFSGPIRNIGVRLIECDVLLTLPMATEYQERPEGEKESMVVYWDVSEER